MQGSADAHDAGACSSVQAYCSESRPSYHPSWTQDIKTSVAHVPPVQSSEYRATIARYSDDFLASASSSLFEASASRSRNTTAGRSTSTRTSELIPARKRSSEALKEETQVRAPFTLHQNPRSDDLNFSHLAPVPIQHP